MDLVRKDWMFQITIYMLAFGEVPDDCIHDNFIKTILNDGNKGMGHEILR